MPIDYALYDISYVNVIMYGAVLPSYESAKDKRKAKDAEKTIKVDDPKNKDQVKKIFDSFD